MPDEQITIENGQEDVPIEEKIVAITTGVVTQTSINQLMAENEQDTQSINAFQSLISGYQIKIDDFNTAIIERNALIAEIQAMG